MSCRYLILALVLLIAQVGYAATDASLAGGTRLVQLQNDDGGWAWPLTGGSSVNTIGPIGMGLAKAYRATGDDGMYVALGKVSAFLRNKVNNFSATDGYLAAELDSIFGGNTNVAYMQANFYGPLAAGSYYHSKEPAGNYDTEGFIQWMHEEWAGIPNAAAWDIGLGLVGAAACKADISAWVDGVKAEINSLDSTKHLDVLGLAGALYSLAYVNAEFDPTSGSFSEANSLADLAQALASKQLDSGGFPMTTGDTVGEIQTTSYAVLALNQVGGHEAVVRKAINYLKNQQLETGGWLSEENVENNEYTAEALWAINSYGLSMRISGVINSGYPTGVEGDWMQVGPIGGYGSFDWGRILAYSAAWNLPQVSYDLDKFGWAMSGTVDSIFDHMFTYSGAWYIGAPGYGFSTEQQCLETGTFSLTTHFEQSWATGKVSGILRAENGPRQPAGWPAAVDWSAMNPARFEGEFDSVTNTLTGVVTGPAMDILSLDANTLFIQPGVNLIVTMNVDRLSQPIDGCQALVGFKSDYFNLVSAAAGGGVWDQIIVSPYNTNPGEVDMWVTVEGAPTSYTQEPGTVAKLTLQPKIEGKAQLVFRPDGEGGYGTYLSAQDCSLISPLKVNSQMIIIDGTKPVMGAVTADPESWTNADTIQLAYSATDPLSGELVKVASGIKEYRITVNGSTFTTDETTFPLNVSAFADGEYTVYVTAVDKAGNVSDPAAVQIFVDRTAPEVTISDLNGEKGQFSGKFIQGDITFTVDVNADLSGQKSLVVTVDGDEITPNIDGIYTYNVNATTANGEHTISATAVDNAGNEKTVTRTFEVNKNQITGQVQLEGYKGESRIVTFWATGGESSKMWLFEATAWVTDYVLTDVPDGTTHISAKTNWSLRVKLALEEDANNQWTAYFTGSEPTGTTLGTGYYLPGGDIDDTNSVNVLDYSMMKLNWGDSTVGDIDGDGDTWTGDYAIMKANWFRVGDDL